MVYNWILRLSCIKPARLTCFGKVDMNIVIPELEPFVHVIRSLSALEPEDLIYTRDVGAGSTFGPKIHLNFTPQVQHQQIVPHDIAP